MRRAGIVIAPVLAVLPTLNACQQCPPTIFRDPPAFTVTDAHDGAAIPDVEATLTNAHSKVWKLDCAYAPATKRTECSWPEGAPIVAGTYTLQIKAPYFKSATLDEEVATVSYCGDSISRFHPEAVSLERL